MTGCQRTDLEKKNYFQETFFLLKNVLGPKKGNIAQMKTVQQNGCFTLFSA